MCSFFEFTWIRLPFSRNGATNGDCSNVRTSLTKYLYHLYHFTEEKIGFDYYIKYKYISSNFRNFCSHRYNPRETCPCIRESRGGEERCTDYERIDERSRTTIFGCIQGENSCLIRQRRTYAPFALDRGANGFEGRNLADRDINPEWTQRDAGGNYARYIFPPSRVIGIPEAHASHDPLAPRWQPLFRDGDDPFCDDESRRRLCRWAGVWRRDNETRSI